MSDDGPILLYDGECGLCARSVRFLLSRDREGRLRYAALQGEVGRRLLSAVGIESDLSTMVLIEDGAGYVRSTGMLRACQYLPAPWRWATWLLIVPRPLRDWCYRVVARNRYRWFGRGDACGLATEEEMARFLDR